MTQQASWYDDPDPYADYLPGPSGRYDDHVGDHQDDQRGRARD